MNPEETKKEVSSLKFSDFQSAGMTFDHSKGDIMEAMGIGEEEASDMKQAMLGAIKELKTGTVSEIIEKTLNVDAPTKWKVIGLFKAGESMAASRMFQALVSIPEDMPGPIMKATLMMSILGGK